MHIEQTSEPLGESQWKWSVWLEGTDKELDNVQEVTYHLHPTFAKPEQKRTDRSTKFRLDSSGWGTFVIKVDILEKDGSTQQLRHRLQFSHDEPCVFVSASSEETGEVDKVAKLMKSLGINVRTAQDVPADSDVSYIREQIDRAKAVILINGTTPSRWVMQDVEIAKSLGKPIFSVGTNSFYDAKDAMEIASVNELKVAMNKL